MASSRSGYGAGVVYRRRHTWLAARPSIHHHHSDALLQRGVLSARGASRSRSTLALVVAR
eukprot:5725710-Alexandrium_andersonii.AAC.1